MAEDYEWVETGIKRKDKNYFLDYRNADGRRIRLKVGPSLQQARIAYKQREVERAQNKVLGIKTPQKILMKDFIPKYLEYSKQNKKANSSLRDQTSINHLLPFFGALCLHEIKPSIIEDYKTERLKAVSNSTVNREIGCLKALLNKAVEWDIITENPIRKLKKLKEPPGRIRYLLKHEIPLLLMYCASHIKPIVITALYTGMRRGELLELQWKDLDFDAGFIHVERSRSRKLDKADFTKSGKRRDIPMSQTVREALEQLPRSSNYVFRQGDFRKGFEGALKRAGISDFHFHDLRHTFASHLVMQGTSIMIVKELLGHETLDMTLRYAHLTPDLKREEVKRLEKTWS